MAVTVRLSGGRIFWRGIFPLITAPPPPPIGAAAVSMAQMSKTKQSSPKKNVCRAASVQSHFASCQPQWMRHISTMNVIKVFNCLTNLSDANVAPRNVTDIRERSGNESLMPFCAANDASCARDVCTFGLGSIVLFLVLRAGLPRGVMDAS